MQSASFFPFPLGACTICGGKRRALSALSITVCMRCVACPRCGSKYRAMKNASSLAAVDATCLVCGPLEQARQRRPFTEARPLRGSMLTLFDTAGTTLDVTLYTSARLGFSQAGQGRSPLPTPCKLLRRTDGQWIVYGGPTLWPNATLYVGPTLVDAALELTALLAHSHDPQTLYNALSALGTLPRNRASLPAYWAARRVRGANFSATPSTPTPSAAIPVKSRGRKYPGCGHRRSPKSPDRCGLCRASQTSLF